MRKSLLLIILVISGFICSAQLVVKDGSFKKVDGFVNINIEKMYDDNEKPYAVLKIKTENINDKQRRELSFGGDAQTFFETEYKDGEVWLYISYYATFLKISHPDLSSTEFWFPFDMEPKCGYELTLVNNPPLTDDIINRIEKLESISLSNTENSQSFGYIIITTTPINGATVLIDGQEMKMKTPFVSDKIATGVHRIVVSKESYKDYVDLITIKADEIERMNIDLQQDEMIVIKNDEYVGKTLTFKRSSKSRLALDGVNLSQEEAIKTLGKTDYKRFRNSIRYRKLFNCTYPFAASCLGAGIGAAMSDDQTNASTIVGITYGIVAVGAWVYADIKFFQKRNNIINNFNKQHNTNMSLIVVPEPYGIAVVLNF